MKTGIHPKYQVATVHCACGNRFETLSVKDDISTEVCSACHPVFTGDMSRRRIVDTEGRVEKFMRKYQNYGGKK
ncbi:MAG: 50S ribosomal protein L31 [Fimbriimonadia bacterium]|nr:50S ribosomal protein L31 [Fimbriimonadia bacterium]